MGTYYNPGIDVTQGRVGRKLDTFMYDSAIGTLRPGEHLYACIEFTAYTAAHILLLVSSLYRPAILMGQQINSISKLSIKHSVSSQH